MMCKAIKKYKIDKIAGVNFHFQDLLSIKANIEKPNNNKLTSSLINNIKTKNNKNILNLLI